MRIRGVVCLFEVMELKLLMRNEMTKILTVMMGVAQPELLKTLMHAIKDGE